MLAKGNGKPERCVANLLRITRGEVPFERIKGIDAALYDRPAPLIDPEVRADMEYVISTYEPRINVDQLDLGAVLTDEGQFGIHARITGR